MSDLIKKSDAIGAITNHCENECYYRVDNWCPQCQREEFQEAIKAVPSADRPKGEWIMHIDDLFPCESTQECSVCHAEQLINGNDDNFCPNCGARMSNASNASNTLETLETLEKGETE